MKNIFLILVFIFIVMSVYGQRPVTFDRFSLNDDKNQTIRIIKSEYSGRFTIDEYGGYIIAVNDSMTV